MKVENSNNGLSCHYILISTSSFISQTCNECLNIIKTEILKKEKKRTYPILFSIAYYDNTIINCFGLIADKHSVLDKHLVPE